MPPIITLPPSTTQIVESIIDRVSGLHVDQGGYVKTIAKGAGSIDRMDKDAAQDMLHQMGAGPPAIFVVLDDIRGFEGTVAGTRYRAEAEIVVYCVNDHRESLTDGRLDPIDRSGIDPALDPGVRTLYESVHLLLAGWVPSAPSSGRLEPIRGTTRHVSKGFTIWEWRFVCKIELGGNIDLDPPTPITSARVTNKALDRDHNVAVEIVEDLQ